jgi:ComF family protein
VGAGEAVFSSSQARIREDRASETAAASVHALSRPWKWANRAAESVFAVLFPSDCRICATPLFKISRLPVCEECLTQIRPMGGLLCGVCGERVQAAYALPAVDGGFRCPECSRTSPPFTRAIAYGSYEGGLRELIHLLKYGGMRPAANVLGRMLAEAIAALELENRNLAVIPVPLHKTKRRQRGFNQADLIARSALKLQAAPGCLLLAPDVLERKRETSSQIGLTAHQRRENLRGAFTVNGAEQIKDREVLLVDDVLTTGTTASECARVLLRAGARRVWVATVARTLKMASQSAGIAPGRVEVLEVPLAKAAVG